MPGMSKKGKPGREGQPGQGDAPAGAGDVSSAGAEVDAELRRFEDFAAALKRAPLNSQKNIERAAEMLSQAQERRDRFVEQLQALIASLNVARTRQEAAEGVIQARAQEIERRAHEFAALLERLNQLGQDANAVGALVRNTASSEGESQEAVRVDIPEIRERMAKLATQADALARDAQATDMVDVARQADALRQMLASVHKKIIHLEQTLKAPQGEGSSTNGSGSNGAPPDGSGGAGGIGSRLA